MFIIFYIDFPTPPCPSCGGCSQISVGSVAQFSPTGTYMSPKGLTVWRIECYMGVYESVGFGNSRSPAHGPSSPLRSVCMIR